MLRCALPALALVLSTWTGGAARAQDAAADPAQALRAGKVLLRERRAALPLPEKVAQLLLLQRLQLPLIRSQRPLRSWERPWEIQP
jgi:hypothetical protein